MSQSQNNFMLKKKTKKQSVCEQFAKKRGRRGQRGFDFISFCRHLEMCNAQPPRVRREWAGMFGKGGGGGEAANNTMFAYLLIDRRQSHFDLSSLIALCG